VWWYNSVGRSSSREVDSLELAVDWPELNQIRNELLKERQYYLNWGYASWLEDVRRGEQATRSGQAM